MTRSTLSNLPIYFMSFFSISNKVRLRLKKIQRDFLWGGKALKKKPHLAKSLIVCIDERKRVGFGC